MKLAEDHKNPAKGTIATIGNYTGRYLGRAGRFDLWQDIEVPGDIGVFWARDAWPSDGRRWIKWAYDAATDSILASLFTPAEFCDWYKLVPPAQHEDTP